MDTKIIKLNRILKKIDVIDQFVEKRLLSWEKTSEEVEHEDALFYTMTEKAQSRYKRIKAKSSINFKMKNSRVGYTPRLIQVHDHIEKLKLLLDPFLWPLININFRFSKERGRYAGLYSDYHNRPEITIKMYAQKEDNEENVLKVVNHEIGHAWSFQLAKIIGWEKAMKIMQQTLMKFLIEKEVLSPDDKKMSFSQMRPFLREHLSNYSAKNIDEAFAEIFMFAYPPYVGYWSFTHSVEKHSCCLKAINHFNELLKPLIVEAFEAN